GRAKRRGLVVELGVDAPAGIVVAPIERIVEEVPPPLVALALWLADYYGTTPARALALVAPVQRRPRGERERPALRESLDGEAPPAQLSAAQTVVAERIVAAIDARAGGNFLLFRATGSGQTQAHLHASAAVPQPRLRATR